MSEVLGDAGDELRRRGGDKGEFGATTGRPRRVGWFDAVATKYGCMVQGRHSGRSDLPGCAELSGRDPGLHRL